LRTGLTKNIIIPFCSLLLLYWGCSSSGSTRYGTTTETTDPNKPSVRFTSVDDTMVVDLNLDLKDPGDLPADEPDVELTGILSDYSSGTVNNSTTSLRDTPRERMLMEIIKYLDTPYKYGGNSKDGIDCSAFTQNLYRDILSINLLRSARLQFTQGQSVSNKQDLQFGDLVFFNTRQRVRPGHVGIYIGDKLFAHASTAKGVTISSMDLDYYSQRFMGGRRIDSHGLTEKTQ